MDFRSIERILLGHRRLTILDSETANNISVYVLGNENINPENGLRLSPSNKALWDIEHALRSPEAEKYYSRHLHIRGLCTDVWAYSADRDLTSIGMPFVAEGINREIAVLIERYAAFSGKRTSRAVETLSLDLKTGQFAETFRKTLVKVYGLSAGQANKVYDIMSGKGLSQAGANPEDRYGPPMIFGPRPSVF